MATSKSIWGWLGCGCAAAALLLVIVVAAIAFVGVRTARTMSDPEARAERALALLDASALPPGYDVQLVMDIPLMADLVVLRGERRQLVFLSGTGSAADVEVAFETDAGLDETLAALGVQIGRDRSVLARGRSESGDAEIRWAMVDGPIAYDIDRRRGGASFIDFDLAEFDLPDSASGEAQLGVAFLVRCPGRRPGLGIHVGPRLAEATRLDDERAAFDAFLDGFGFCR